MLDVLRLQALPTECELDGSSCMEEMSGNGCGQTNTCGGCSACCDTSDGAVG